MKSRALEGLRVVLVDDDPDARELLTTVILQRGADVLAASSAAEAFELVCETRPHVLVSDIAMPEEDGYMLVRKLRALPEADGGRTMAIAVTAFAGRADQRRALEAGFDAHFPKPIDLDGLVDRLLELRSTLLPSPVSGAQAEAAVGLTREVEEVG